MNTLQILEAVHEFVELLLIVDKEFDGTFKKAFFGLNGDSGNVDLQIAADDGRDLVNNAYVVHAYNFQTGKEGNFLILGPFRLYNPMPVIRQQFGCIGTGSAVNRQPLSCGYKPKY